MKTAFNATRLVVGAFIVPYVFSLNPAMLFLNEAGQIGGVSIFSVVSIVISALVGIYSVAAGLGGYLEDHLNPILRIVLCAGGLCLLIPGTITDLIGLAVLVGVIALQRMNRKKAAA